MGDIGPIRKEREYEPIEIPDYPPDEEPIKVEPTPDRELIPA